MQGSYCFSFRIWKWSSPDHVTPVKWSTRHTLEQRSYSAQQSFRKLSTVTSLSNGQAIRNCVRTLPTGFHAWLTRRLRIMGRYARMWTSKIFPRANCAPAPQAHLPRRAALESPQGNQTEIRHNRLFIPLLKYLVSFPCVSWEYPSQGLFWFISQDFCSLCATHIFPVRSWIRIWLGMNSTILLISRNLIGIEYCLLLMHSVILIPLS